MVKQTVDFHAHIIPEFYTRALKAAGFNDADGAVVADGYPVPAGAWTIPFAAWTSTRLR